jgi:hypothetical protein
MPRKQTPKRQPSRKTAPKKPQDPEQVVHLQVKPGERVRLGRRVFGDKATLQMRRRELDRLEGSYEEVTPGEGDLPPAA